MAQLALILDTSVIRTLDGLYSLNDLHKASGGASKHRPAYFLENQQTKDLLAEIEIAGIPAITAKPKIGTYACRELVIAYAAWISAVFHLKVIRVFLTSVTVQSKIDPHALLLDGQSDLMVPLPEDVQRALDVKAWQLAGEAYSLIHEHLRRRVARNAIAGQHDVVYVDKALRVIENGDLGDALTHCWRQKMNFILHNAKIQAQAAREYLGEVREAMGSA